MVIARLRREKLRRLRALKEGRDPEQKRVEISAKLSRDGQTETIVTKSGGRTTTRISRRGGGSVILQDKISQEKQRQIAAQLERATMERQRQLSLAEQKEKLSKLEFEKGLRAEIRDRRGRIIQRAREEVDVAAQTKILSLRKKISKKEKEALEKQKRAESARLISKLFTKPNVLKQIEVPSRTADVRSTLSRISPGEAFLNVFIKNPRSRKIILTAQDFINPQKTTINAVLQSVDISDKTRKGLRSLQQDAQKSTSDLSQAKAALLGIAQLPLALIDSSFDIIDGIVQVGKDPVAIASGIASLNSKSISQIGSEMGKRGLSGDPKFLTDVAVGLALSGNNPTRVLRPIRIPKFAGTRRTINKLVFSPDELKTTQSLIAKLEDIPNPTRDQINLLKNLRLQEDIFKKSKFITAAEDSIKSDIIKHASSGSKSSLTRINNKIDNVNTKIDDVTSTIKKSPQVPRLTDAKKSELLGKLLKERPKPVIKPATLTKSQKNTLQEFIKQKNSVSNRIFRLQDRLKNKRLNNIEKLFIERELKFFESLKQNIPKKFFDINKLTDSKASKLTTSELINEVSKLTSNIKSAKKIVQIFTKLNKLQSKIKLAGFGDINLLPPNTRDRVLSVLNKISSIKKLTQSQLGSLNKSLDNLLKISFKKSDSVKKFNRKAFIEEIIKGKKASSLSRQDLNEILSQSNPKTTLKSRLSRVNSQISKLENQVSAAKSFGKSLSKPDRKKLGEQISDALQEIRTLKSTQERLSTQLKLPQSKLNQRQALARQQLFSDSIKNKKDIKVVSRTVTDTTKTKTFKFGDFELEVELKNFGLDKKGTVGLQTPKKKPQVSFNIKRVRDKNIKPIADDFAKKAKRASNNDSVYQKILKRDENLKRLDRKAELQSRRKDLTKKQKTQLNNARKNIKSLIKLNDRALLFRTFFLFSREFKLDNLVVPDQKQIFKQLTAGVNQLENVFQPLEKKPKPFIKPDPSKGPVTTTKPVSVPRKRVVPQPRPVQRPSRRPKKTKKVIEKPLKLRLPFIDWDLKKKDNRVLVFDIVYRERRNKSKNFNKKTNPVITKTISVTTTRNRALNKAAFIADNSSPRSIDIKLVGGTKLKTKDVGLSKIVKKFNRQPKTNSLKFLEDPKFTIDTSGEKRGLALARKRAPTTATKKTLKKKPTKPTKNKKSSQNRSKRSKL